MKTKHGFAYLMLIFPLLELALFLVSFLLLTTSVLLATVCFVLAVIAFNYTLHITLHECVHFRRRYPRVINFGFSCLTGLPFSGYRLHHYNHHHCNNSLKDYSTTWMLRDDVKLPRPLLNYCLMWPRQIVRPRNDASLFAIDTDQFELIKNDIFAEKIMLALLFVLLACLSLPFFLLYIGLVYLGWSAIALQNYGQHPPKLEDKQECINTFSSRVYNKLLFNNGLHWEHHQSPGQSWYFLAQRIESPRIHLPHLAAPFFIKFKESKA